MERSGADERPGEAGGLPLLPGFREMAIRRMSAERRRLVGELAEQRRTAGLSQTEVAARMGTSQSAVARLEAGTRTRGPRRSNGTPPRSAARSPGGCGLTSRECDEEDSGDDHLPRRFFPAAAALPALAAGTTERPGREPSPSLLAPRRARRPSPSRSGSNTGNGRASCTNGC